MKKAKILPKDGRKLTIVISQEAYQKLCIARIFHLDSTSLYLEHLILKDVEENRERYFEKL